VVEKVKLETKDEKYHMDRLKKRLVVAYDKIPKRVKTIEPMMTHKIDHIVKKIDQYRKEIKKIWEQIIPTTPMEVNDKRRKEAARQMEEME
jgi:hypothetical protein